MSLLFQQEQQQHHHQPVVTTATAALSSSSAFEIEDDSYVNMNNINMDNNSSNNSNNNMKISRQEPSLLSWNNNTHHPQEEQQPELQDRGILREWLYDSVWPGMGLFGESYMLFSIGTLTPIWQMIFPNCFVYNTTCSVELLHSLSFAVVSGIILGMILLGLLAGNCGCSIGRRRGSIVTAMLMSCGAIGLTVASFVLVDISDSDNENGGQQEDNGGQQERLLVQTMAISLFIFGIGVGGEYPMAAASASEKAMERLHQRIQLEQAKAQLQQQHVQQQSQLLQQPVPADSLVVVENSRGRKVQLVFTMQGMGIFCNSLLMTILLLVYHDDDDDENGQQEYNEYNDVTSLIFIWRITYSLGTLVLLGVLCSRYLYLQESSVWKEQQEQSRQIQQQQQQQEEEQHEEQSTTTSSVMVAPPPLGIAAAALAATQNVSAVVGNVTAATSASAAAAPPPPAILDETVSTMTMTQKMMTTTTTLQKSPSIISTVSSLSLPSVVDDSYMLFMLNTGSSSHNNNASRRTSSGIAMTSGCCSPMMPTSLPIVHELQDPDDDEDDCNNDQCRSSPNNNKTNTSNSIEAGKQQQRQQRRQQKQQHYSKWKLLRLFVKNYGMRLFGASSCWLLWDVAFYGNKLFQSTFILALTGGINDPNGNNDDEAIATATTTLLQFSGAATLNAGVALCGYFTAALLVDHPRLGRRGLQLTGFALTGMLFVLCAFLYPTTAISASPVTLVLLYFATSFFGQVGPNATTFLLPAEIFPTAVRTQCHGIAAASGKVGALIAAFWFPHLATTTSNSSSSDDDTVDSSAMDLFLVSGYASLAACAITYWTIPETAGLDLYEMDKKWTCIVQGKKGDYHGQANQAQFLSPYERFKLLLRQQQATHYNHAADAY